MVLFISVAAICIILFAFTVWLSRLICPGAFDSFTSPIVRLFMEFVIGVMISMTFGLCIGSLVYISLCVYYYIIGVF